MRAYAAPADYAAAPWDGTATAGELQLASLVVDAALGGAVYVVDAAGLPTDPQVAEALRDATCAVLKAAQAAAPPPGVLPGLKAAKIGGVEYTLEAAAGSAASAGPEALPFTARQILLNAGLGRGAVYIVG